MTVERSEAFAFLVGGGEMGYLIRTKDWRDSPLGPPENWPQSLCTAVNLLLNSQFPMFVWWGPELITLYNDAYRIVAGDKHPQLLGASGKIGWSEIWKDLSPLVDSVFQGKATWSDDQPLFIRRHGYIEETYFTFSYSPILEGSGEVAGLFCACIETTDKVLANRRLAHSERNLRSMLLQSPVATTIMKGERFVVEIANRKMYELWGRGPEEVLMRPAFEALPELRYQGLEEILLHVYRTGESFTAKERPLQLLRSTGLETFYLNFVYEPFREPDGTISGVLAVAMDVTDQVVARRRVEESEARTRLAASSANLGLYELDLKDQSFRYSPRLLEIFGLASDRQWPYQTFQDAVLKEDLPVRQAAHDRSQQMGELLFEVRIQRPDGAIRWIRSNGTFIWEDGQPRSLLGTVMDITEEKKAAELLEQKIQERTRELQQLNAQLSQFTYAASHDLKEPLRKISFFLDRLLQAVSPELRENNQFLSDRIRNATERMRGLIDDLLEYSNTTFGTWEAVPVDLSQLVTEVLDDMEATRVQKQAVISLQPLPSVTGDPRQLRQLFQNLLSNALKYHKHGEPPQVAITCNVMHEEAPKLDAGADEESQPYFDICVRDEGIGFDATDTERIFQLFQRLHGKTEYEGTGIGLAIAKKVVDNHHGRIWAESAPGKGAAFHILLPCPRSAKTTNQL